MGDAAPRAEPKGRRWAAPTGARTVMGGWGRSYSPAMWTASVPNANSPPRASPFCSPPPRRAARAAERRIRTTASTQSREANDAAFQKTFQIVVVGVVDHLIVRPCLRGLVEVRVGSVARPQERVLGNARGHVRPDVEAGIVEDGAVPHAPEARLAPIEPEDAEQQRGGRGDDQSAREGAEPRESPSPHQHGDACDDQDQDSAATLTVDKGADHESECGTDPQALRAGQAPRPGGEQQSQPQPDTEIRIAGVEIAVNERAEGGALHRDQPVNDFFAGRGQPLEESKQRQQRAVDECHNAQALQTGGRRDVPCDHEQHEYRQQADDFAPRHRRVQAQGRAGRQGSRWQRLT